MNVGMLPPIFEYKYLNSFSNGSASKLDQENMDGEDD